MLIIQNPDKEYAKEIRKALKDNNYFCPCALEKNKDTKCLCKDFRSMKEGMCTCGLYIKVKDDD